MKSFKLFAAGLLAASLLGSAIAADLGTVRITGSSAYRAATLNGLKNLFKTTGTHPLHYGYAGSSFTGSTFAIFDGELLGGDTVRIATNFTGSSAGIQTIVQTPAITIPFLDTVYGSLATSGTSGITAPGAGSSFAADIAMSDVAVTLTPWQRATDKTVASPADVAPVGVIPFYWVASNGADASITYVTAQIIKGVANGGLPRSFWTGNNAHSDLVKVVGRNADSGTRLTAFEESGYGALVPVTQFQPTPVATTATGGTVTGLTLYPAESVLGITYGAGKSGYSSGGTLSFQFERPSNVNFVGYLGRSDAINAVLGDGLTTGSQHPGGGRLLTYNGVSAPLTGGTAAMDAPFINGSYSFWSYEQMYFTDDHAGSGDAVETLATLLATEIHDNTAPSSGIKMGDMKVVRAGDGLVVTQP